MSSFHSVAMDENSHCNGVYRQSNTAIYHASMQVVQHSEFRHGWKTMRDFSYLSMYLFCYGNPSTSIDMCFETTDSDPVNTLLAWCATNGVYIDESIRICLQPKGGPGIAVFSLGNYIHPGTICRLHPTTRYAELSDSFHTFSSKNSEGCCTICQSVFFV